MNSVTFAFCIIIALANAIQAFLFCYLLVCAQRDHDNPPSLGLKLLFMIMIVLSMHSAVFTICYAFNP